MNRILKIVSIVLLLFNGLGAFFGGWQLMMHPTGESLQLTLDLLSRTPFSNYFLPGLILFTVNGLLSFFVIAVLLISTRYSWLVLLQGAILTGWIGIQILMIREIIFLHVLFGSIGILLMIFGRLMMPKG